MVLAACAPAAPPASQPPTAPASPTATGTTTVPLDDRPFQLYVPAELAPRPALVLVLHGYTATGPSALDFFGLGPLADERGFLLAAPEGTKSSSGDSFWNASSACCNFEGSWVDDSAYLSRVVATVLATNPVDPGQVFIVGHSNGGFMAHRFACEHAEQVAAIASLAGAMDADADCAPTRPVSVLQVHGDADDTIIFDGGAIEGNRYTSAEQTVATWRELNACPAGPGRTGSRIDADNDVGGPDLTPTTWSDCRDGTAVALWRIDDGNHVPSLTAEFSAALFDWLESQRRTA